MTLVVARRSAVGVRLICDSKFTYGPGVGDADRHPMRSTPITGGLKAVIISRSVCIGFAGDVYRAHDALQGIVSHADTHADVQEILLRLFAAHKANRDPDFIVGVATEEQATLHWITRGRIRRNEESAWVGDAQAYEAYVQTFARMPTVPIPTVDPRELEAHQQNIKMLMAFLEVVQSGRFTSVNDIVVQADGGKTGFQYRGILSSQTNRPLSGPPDPDGWRTLELAHDAQRGGYTYEMLASISPGKAAIGVHFAQGNLGLLYYPAISLDAIQIAGVTRDAFVARVDEAHGLQLQIVGTIGSPDGGSA